MPTTPTDRIPVDLRDDGLLWLINRTTFHPRGFALAIEADGTFSLLGTGDEAWRFDPTIEDGLFAAVERCLTRARGVDLAAKAAAGERLAATVVDHVGHADALHTPWALEALAAYRDEMGQ